MKKRNIAIATFALSLLMAKPAFAYDVVKGDTMSKIAREHKLSLGDLIGMNPQVKNPNMIYIGQHITTDGKIVKKSTSSKPVSNKYNISAEDKDLLARLVRAEAEGEPFKGKVAVVEVVLNRLADPKFPKTIKDIIYQPNQFTPTKNGMINRPADAESKRAVDVALTTSVKIVPTSLYFYNPVTTTSRWLDTLETTAVIGSHTFKKEVK